MCGVVDRGDQITFVRMQVRLLFFGNLTDAVSDVELHWELDGDGTSLQQLVEQLEMKHPLLTGKTYRIAVNQRFVELKDTMVSSGDEIAFMPPFSGG